MQQTDHLLPPLDFTDHPTNAVNSCSLCNSVKHDHNVLESGEDAATMLANHRDVLIQRARDYITREREPHDLSWTEARNVVLGPR